MQESSGRRHIALVIAIAAVLIAARSFVFLFYEQANFDADQAILGLMAKHMAERRAFPLFQYGLDYMLAVETWLSSPMFWIVRPSVAALKLPMLGLNWLVAALLITTLTRQAGLRPAEALTASLFFVFPPPLASAELLQTLGGNILPFVFVLLIWLARDRPLTLGGVLAVGFLTREFTIYGFTALLAIEALDRTLLTRANGAAKLRVALAFAATWNVVQGLRQWADPFGPNSVAVTAAGPPATNVGAVLNWVCWDPSTLARSLPLLFSTQLSSLVGARVDPLVDANLNSTVSQGVGGIWPAVVVGVFIVAIARAARLTLRPAAGTPWPRVGVFLVVVGLQAAFVYAIGRCGVLSLLTMRYVLLALFLPIGLTAIFLKVEPSRLLRRGMLTFIGLWALFSLRDHVVLTAEYLTQPPPSEHRALADYLVAHDISYARADYWTAYHIDFLADERVTVTADGFVRIQEYERIVAANESRAVRISRTPCPDGVSVRLWYLCGPAVREHRLPE